MGLITKITYPDDETIEYSYDPNGHVLDRTDQRGWVTEYEYDKSGHMLEKYCTVNNITTECSFTYDGLGRMLTAEKEIDSNAVSYSEFTYSDLGYLAQTEQKIGNGSEYIIEYERDQGGLTSQITYPDPNMDGMVLDIAYTPLGKIASIKRDNDTLAQYTYLGQNVLRRFYQDPCVTLTASFDDFGRTSRLYSHTDTTNIADFLYSYDDNGNITEQLFAHRTSDPCNLYAYDNLDRLTEADYLVGVLTEDEQFTYDKLGNRTTVNLRDGNDETYARNDLTNRYDATGSYDITLDYDDAGNTTEDANDYTYEYDYENRLIKVLDPNDNTIVEYSYDALGRRIEKVAGGVTTRYYYDGWRILSEVEGNTSRNFVYGNYLDEVLMMIVDDGQNQTDHYYAHDHLFSPVALIADDGTVEERYEYDAYGKPTIYNADFNQTYNESQYDNAYMFHGKKWDTLEDGQLQIGKWSYRDYSAGLGRWNQTEKLGVIPNDTTINPFTQQKQYEDGINVFEAFGSNPTTNLDKYGLQKNCPLHLYAKRDDEKYRGRNVKHKVKISDEHWWTFPISTFNNSFGSLKFRLMQQGCCCYNHVSIYDHGAVCGVDPDDKPKMGQFFGGQGELRHSASTVFGRKHLRRLCSLLCKDVTIQFYGCAVGSGSRRGFQPLFNACMKISQIKACKGDVDYGSDKGITCNNGWEIFKR
ncbi:MAG: hypothetical protein K8R53_15610 [Bacteroidales bacterium]|nr:hypothetical protein [Bacteroidales bacterium]